MLRGFRHTLFLLLELGIVLSAALAWAIQPTAWRAIAVCTAGGMVVVWVCERLARKWLRVTLGRLRRVADDLGHGRPAEPLAAQRGDDLYKLVASFNLLASRMEEAAREEARLQEQLRKTERLAFLGELAATVAHEVNNPLDGIQSCVRILRRSGNDPARAQQMLDLIDSGLARLDLIVRRLLTLAREHAIRPVVARLADVLESAIGASAKKMEGRNIRIVRRYEATEDRVLADPLLLEHAFVNLILNAADAMSGGGELTLAITREDSSEAAENGGGRGAVLSVQVIDTGDGISPEVQPRIFEPFFTTKTGGKGTGLGLAIAARIVDAHQGAIEVDSEIGRGTTFTVRLPALGRTAMVATLPGQRGTSPHAATVGQPDAGNVPKASGGNFEAVPASDPATSENVVE